MSNYQTFYCFLFQHRGSSQKPWEVELELSFLPFILVFEHFGQVVFQLGTCLFLLSILKCQNCAGYVVHTKLRIGLHTILYVYIIHIIYLVQEVARQRTLLFYLIEPQKNGPFLDLPSSLCNRHPKQKEFLNSCAGFLRVVLTGHSHPSPF